MACLLTQGYTFAGCKGGAGGLSQVLITEYANLVTAPTLASGIYTAFALATGKQFRLYDLDQEVGIANDDLAYTKESGSNIYTHKTAFKIKGFTTAVQLEIGLIAQNRTIQIVKDNNGAYRVYGLQKGMDLMTAGNATGTNYEDFSGFDLAFETKSTIPAYVVQTSLITTLLSPAA
jgi:hypothetical protein